MPVADLAIQRLNALIGCQTLRQCLTGTTEWLSLCVKLEPLTNFLYEPFLPASRGLRKRLFCHGRRAGKISLEAAQDHARLALNSRSDCSRTRNEEILLDMANVRYVRSTG